MSAKLDNARALYMEGIRDGDVRRAVETYTGERYVQHSTGVRDGVDGFVEFFEPFVERNPGRDIRIVRAIEDGTHVFVHAYQDINDGEARWVTTDFFDTDDDDRVIEHWDVIAPFTPANPSGHSSVDGPTEVTDLDRTDLHKERVREMIHTVLMADGDPRRAGEWFAPSVVRHNGDAVDGLASFERLVTDPGAPLAYNEIVLLVGQGNFVATLCRATRNGVPVAQVDLFRLDDAMIVEHWDNSEPVPDHEVNSGKF